jgi:hypothetical protein
VSFESPEPNDDGPDADVLEMEFGGELWYWRGPSPFHFITVPEEASGAIRAISTLVTYGWGVIPVRVRIGETVFETSLFPKDGRYLVPIKDMVRKAERLALGDMIEVEMAIRR